MAQYFGFVKKNDFVLNLRVLLEANNVDFVKIVDTARSAGQAKLAEAKKFRLEFTRLMRAAENARNQAVDAATAVLKDAMTKSGKSIMTADELRTTAAELLDAATVISKQKKIVAKSIQVMLVFSKMDTTAVLAEMQKAAGSKNAEADRLETAAAEAEKSAQAANDSAASAAEAAFKQAVLAAEPNLKQAKALEQAAAQLVKSVEFFTTPIKAQ